MIRNVLKLEDIPAVPESSMFEIRNMFYLHLYEFFKVYQAGVVYIVDVNGATQEELEERFLLSSEEDYKKFGIYLSTCSLVGTEIQKALLVLDRGVTKPDYDFDAELNEKAYGMPIKMFRDIIVAANVRAEDSAELSNFVTQVAESIPGAVIHNPVLMRMLGELRKYQVCGNEVADGWKKIDCSKFFKDKNCFGINYEMSLSIIRSIVDAVKNEKVDDKTVFVLEELADDRNVQLVFTYLAAYLTMKKQRHFKVPSSQLPLYLSVLRELTSRRGNYLNDYLELLSNPVSAGFYLIDGCAYLSVLDTAKMLDKDGKVRSECTPSFSVCQMQFNPNTLTLVKESGFDERYYDYRRVNPLHLANVFRLRSGVFKESVDNLNRLDLLIADFEQTLLNAGKLGDDLLSCSNVLLYEFNGKTYLGYVPYVECSFPYKMVPLARGYKAFDRMFSAGEYNLIYDISLFDDAMDLILPLAKKGLVSMKGLHYKVPKHSVGCMLQSITARPVKLTEASGFSLEQIGMWSVQSKQGRDGRSKTLLQYVSRRVLRDNHFLTFYGGCVPAVTVSLQLDPSSWRV